jgi:hypothetical protein
LRGIAANGSARAVGLAGIADRALQELPGIFRAPCLGLSLDLWEYALFYPEFSVLSCFLSGNIASSVQSGTANPDVLSRGSEKVDTGAKLLAPRGPRPKRGRAETASQSLQAGSGGETMWRAETDRDLLTYCRSKGGELV